MEGDASDIWPRAISVFKSTGHVRQNFDEQAAIAKWAEAKAAGKKKHFPRTEGQGEGFRVAVEIGLSVLQGMSREEIAAKEKDIFG